REYARRSDPLAPSPIDRSRRSTLKTGICRVVVVAAASALLLAAVASGATSSVTITSPRPGQSVSLKKNPYLAVAGGVSFAETPGGMADVLLVRDSCTQ